MDTPILRVQTLGGFSIRRGEVVGFTGLVENMFK